MPALMVARRASYAPGKPSPVRSSAPVRVAGVRLIAAILPVAPAAAQDVGTGPEPLSTRSTSIAPWRPDGPGWLDARWPLPTALELRRWPEPEAGPLSPAAVPPRFRTQWPQGQREPYGAEDFHQEDKRHRIPEPMVFDLVRPLGARAGELEVNNLGIIPLRSRRTTSGDSLGLVTDSKDSARPEWAPEVEYALWDGFAVEFELPFEGTRLEAWKFAAQYTFGTDASGTFVHGMQGILQYNIEPRSYTPTLVYMAGKRLAEYWSALAMIGGRTDLGGESDARRDELLINLSLFLDVGRATSVGLETNLGLASGGRRNVLLMPQLHLEVTDRWMLQAGAGVRFDENDYLPEAAFRLIYTF